MKLNAEQSVHASILRRIAAFALIPALLAAALSARSWADESIYLQSGEQYRGVLTEISADSVVATVRGERRQWPIEAVQRIEFQRSREYDGLETPAALSAASDYFRKALAQSTADLKAKYPQAGHVILQWDTKVTVDSGAKCHFEETTAWRILEQRSSDSGFQSMTFFPDTESAEILYAITVDAEGNVSRLDDSTVKTESVHPGQSEYDFLKRVRFSMKNPLPGSTLFLRTSKTARASELQPFLLDTQLHVFAPVLEAAVTLEADPSTLPSVMTATRNMQHEKGALVWRVTDAPQLMPEPLMPPTVSFVPRVIIGCPQTTWGKVAFDFIAAIGAVPLKADGVDSSTAAYDKVRLDVRSIGVPMSHLPRLPARPEVVLRRGFGNAVEKALLLESLLDGLGLEAHTVLVRRRSSGPLVEEVPSISQLDAVLVRLVNPEGGETWLNPGDRLAGFGEIPSDFEGATGLDLTTGKLVSVSADPGSSAFASRCVLLELDADGNTTITDDFLLRGAAARAYRFISDMTAEEADKWAATMVGGEDPGTRLLEWSHSDMSKVSREETLHFRYTVPAVAQKAGDFLIMRMANARYSPTDVGRATRRYGLFWSGIESTSLRYDVRAPQGYRVYAAPEGYRFEESGWRLVSQFSASDDGTSLVFTDDWSRMALDAPATAYQALRQALIRRGLTRNEVLVFTK